MSRTSRDFCVGRGGVWSTCAGWVLSVVGVSGPGEAWAGPGDLGGGDAARGIVIGGRRMQYFNEFKDSAARGILTQGRPIQHSALNVCVYIYKITRKKWRQKKTEGRK